MPTHRDEPRCESEEGQGFITCLALSVKAHTHTHKYPHKLRGTPRVESPIRSHRRALSPNDDPRWLSEPARLPTPKATNPRLERTAAMAAGDGFGLVTKLGWPKYGPMWSSAFLSSTPDRRPSGP